MVNPKAVKYILWICLVASVTIFTIYSSTHVPKITHDYGAYYKFSRALIEGRNIGALYDSTSLNDPRYSYGITDADVSSNIPTNAFTLLPFAWMDAYSARIAWSLFSIILYVVAIYILFRTYNISWREKKGLVLLTLLFLWFPTYSNLALGQLYLLLLFLFSLSLWGAHKKRLLLTSFPIAVALLLKGYGIIPLLWLIYHKRWREAMIVIGAVAIVIAGTLPLLGIETWSIYYHAVFLRLGQMPTDSFVAYQAVNNFMRHLFLYSKDWNPYPLVALPAVVVFTATIIINLFIISAIIIISSKAKNIDLSYAAAIAVGVVTSPLTFEYHYILFLPLVIILVATLFNNDRIETRNMRTIGILSAIFILALPLPYAKMQSVSSPLVLLAYPKLYAGLALLLLAVFPRRSAAKPAH